MNPGELSTSRPRPLAGARAFLPLAAVAVILAGCDRSPSADTPPDAAATTPAAGAATNTAPPAETSPPTPPAPTLPAAFPDPPADLVIEEVQEGAGPAIREGSWAIVHSLVTTSAGARLEDTRGRGAPAEMFLTGSYLEGLNRGLLGMKPGGVRKLVIPPHLAYGDTPPRGGRVPPGETLFATLECLQVLNGPSVLLPSGLRIESDGRGEGPASRYGTFVTCDVLIMAGTGQRVVYDSSARGGPIELGLPGPPGINVARRLDPEIPWLGPALYGIRAGEFRQVFIPGPMAYRGNGYFPLGITPNEPITYEISCRAVHEGPVIQLENGLKIEDLEVGQGKYLRVGQWATFREEMLLADGTVIFTNLDASQPTSVSLIPRVGPDGWNRGVVGMRVGGRRRLTIPADLAYGDKSPQGFPNIPPGATLTFTVHLLDVHRSRPATVPGARR